MDLGADGWQTFRYIILPNLGSALLAGGMLAVPLINFLAGYGWACFGITVAAVMTSIDNFSYVISGVIRLDVSHALPTSRLAAASRSCRRNAASSYTSVSQTARLAAEHFWPL